jgi:peptidoglycan/LPS O-acetylase OafA/YrhL
MTAVEIEIFVWLGLVTFLFVNGFAAGIAALLLTLPRRIRRWGRISFSAMAAGLLPASVMMLAAIDPSEFDVDGPLYGLLAFAMIFLIGSIGAIPGGWLITRRLERPSDDYRVFE